MSVRRVQTRAREMGLYRGTGRKCQKFQRAERKAMPDAARIAQAQALEVPVILQGAKTADQTGKRELFTENATTTLVLENGAVLNLRSKLVVGQAIFIHNKQNGREILCKVLEAPAEGQAGYTDLEFTTADPEFWHVNAQRPEASTPKPEAAADKP